VPFSNEDHKDLAQVLKAAKGKWLLTINDHPLARELYRGYWVAKAKTRLGIRKVLGGSRPPLLHLIVINYEPPGDENKWRWRTL
jgi:DNA adenine methylase